MLVLDDGLHRALQRVVALLESLHKPLCRIQLLLHKRGRLLLLPVRRPLSLDKKLSVLAIHTDFRNIETRHRQFQLSVHNVQHEIRHNLLSLIVVGIINLASRSRVQLDDLSHDGLHLLLAQSKFRDDLLEMPV